MSKKYPGLTVTRVDDGGPNKLRAVAALTHSRNGIRVITHFFRTRSDDVPHWYIHIGYGNMLTSRTLKELLTVWRLHQ